MKINLFEDKYVTSFRLTPETIEEVATLARIAKSSRAEKPHITFYFYKEPSCSILIRKVKEKAQRNSLSNKIDQ